MTFSLGRSFKIPFNDFTINLPATLGSFVLMSLTPQWTTIAFTGPATASSDFTDFSVSSSFSGNTQDHCLTITDIYGVREKGVKEKQSFFFFFFQFHFA